MIEQIITTLQNINENKIAILLLDALSRHSKVFEQFDELAMCYFKIKEYEKAYTCAERALSLYSGSNIYSVKYNVLNSANHANYPERALSLIKQLELLNPFDSDLQMEKAFSMFLLNRKQEAEVILRKQLENPNNSEAVKTRIRFNLGTYELLRDEFQNGLRKFLFEGRKLDYWKKPILPFTMWKGEIEPGKTIYIRTEAGIGDEFINIRFMNNLKERGMIPIWFTEREDMKNIFNRNGYTSVSNLEPTEKKEDILWVHSMDLPVYLNLNYEDLWNGPYLKADKEVSGKYKNMFKELDGLKIGIRWQGNPSYDQDLHRSIPLKELLEVIPKENTNIISLQRDDGIEELEEYPHVKDMSPYLENYEETLGIIENLDVIVTSCTSIAHAAAAMGKRTIVITPISAYYVWCHSTEKSPWYGDNVTLLRQQKPRVWNEPLSQLKELFENAEFSN
jgi:hypothetical protein